MNVLVTGANGQLGCEMRILAAQGGANRFLFTDVTEASDESVAMLRKLAGDGVDVSTRRLDITDPDAIRALVRDERIDAVVNCAAYTNVDAAEDHFELAELLNAKAPEHLALAMKEVGGLLVHISTDYVFGGDPYNTPCREEQTGTPTGVYGLTKLHGEQAIQASGCRCVILRTAWLYSEFGKNFVRTMLRLTVEKPQLKVVFDQAGTPTYAGDLADAIGVILKDYALHSLPAPESYPRCGIYHYSNEGVCSWYDFTIAIHEVYNMYLAHGVKQGEPIRCKVRPILSEEYQYLTPRPHYSVLNKAKVRQTFALNIPHWRDSLIACMRNM